MKIRVGDTEKIQAALDKVQAKCQSRTLDASEVETAAQRASALLTQIGIPKRLWRGFKILVDPYRVPNAYRYSAESTQVSITCTSGTNFFMTAIRRKRCPNVSYGSSTMGDTYEIVETPDLLTSLLANHHITAIADRAPDALRAERERLAARIAQIDLVLDQP